MSDTQIVMNFEFLPNEILMECFEYLNAFEIFYSFDGLNDRFTQLIQTIPLYLNFEHVRKSIFDQFCTKMILHPEIKNQIYSLHLSDENTCGQTEVFLSLFSIHEFLYLRSLTLVHLADSNIEKLKTMLPFLSQRHSFHIMQPIYCEIESSPILTCNNQMLSIRSLTVSNCSLVDLIKILKYMPMLKYLQVQPSYNLSREDIATEDVDDYHAVHLKRLIIDQFDLEFDELELFVRKAPNLTNLTICSNASREIVDASRWEYLIRSSLPNLITFNFAFKFILNSNFSFCASDYSDEDNSFAAKYKQFQTKFWRDEHHWYTEYILWDHSACLYTIPYKSKTCELKLNTERYYVKSTNNSKTFENVTDLKMHDKMIGDKCDCYFSNITSLEVDASIQSPDYLDRTSKPDYIQNLKTIINLSSLNHVCFSSDSRMASSKVLLQLLKEAPQLSSMGIGPIVLISFFDDDELCTYLNKMIKKIDLRFDRLYQRSISKNLMKFCKIFSNLEQLKCNIVESDDVLCLVNHLSKLSLFYVYSMIPRNTKMYFSRFENQAKKQNIFYRIVYSHINRDTDEVLLRIWCG